MKKYKLENTSKNFDALEFQINPEKPDVGNLIAYEYKAEYIQLEKLLNSLTDCDDKSYAIFHEYVNNSHENNNINYYGRIGVNLNRDIIRIIKTNDADMTYNYIICYRNDQNFIKMINIMDDYTLITGG